MRNNHKSGIPYQGIQTTSDGAGGVVWVETHISQGAGAFPHHLFDHHGSRL